METGNDTWRPRSLMETRTTLDGAASSAESTGRASRGAIDGAAYEWTWRVPQAAAEEAATM